jgi:hypothetical protein
MDDAHAAAAQLAADLVVAEVADRRARCQAIAIAVDAGVVEGSRGRGWPRAESVPSSIVAPASVASRSALRAGSDVPVARVVFAVAPSAITTAGEPSGPRTSLA